MRGKVIEELEAMNESRITPAYAGKREFDWMNDNGCWDHPRVCGEKSATCKRLQRPLGSPPRMRGKEAMNESIKADIRITPAYAGKS